MISTNKRSSQAEIMDTFDFKGQDLVNVLQHIDQINSSLGGHRVTINGVKQLLKKSKKEVITIADIGCGSGASLRAIAKWAEKQKFQVKLIGIDANPYIIEVAKSLTSTKFNISYLCLDVFSAEFKALEFDIVCSSLTFHHFKDQSIIQLLQQLEAQVKLGIIINDLHRHKLAYRLFQLYSIFFVRSQIAKKDGLISILRGFKSKDFKYFSKQLNNATQLKWFWAFRYQFLIQIHG
ncbi:methyltransferase domain-containing protein [Psychroflexus sp. ALD_RP9]|uniref:methyltransferase domain-containing protein n=1 Tax=Psychroflexus sp. ALD_RP9 TaxID=2777186 RepID=UPI001A8C4B22|nr:methyltransferase domain-containing protein [Psychroflexus sp. ALD_RP9]QSS97002.1 methyltransferase domain-containing protein [Psychroflexus sp. ALD_RP9]